MGQLGVLYCVPFQGIAQNECGSGAYEGWHIRGSTESMSRPYERGLIGGYSYESLSGRLEGSHIRGWVICNRERILDLKTT